MRLLLWVKSRNTRSTWGGSCSCDLVADVGKERVVAEDVVLADVAVPRANAIAAAEFGLTVRTSHCRDPADEGEVARRSMLLYAHREIRSDPEHRRDNVDVVPRAANVANGTWPMANDVFRQDPSSTRRIRLLPECREGIHAPTSVRMYLCHHGSPSLSRSIFSARPASNRLRVR